MMELFEELSHEDRELWWASLLAEVPPAEDAGFEPDQGEPVISLIINCSMKEEI
jgi:hypothetical protein